VGERLQAGTKVSPKNMAFRRELIDDAVDCRCGNAEHAATRSEDGDEGAAHVGEELRPVLARLRESDGVIRQMIDKWMCSARRTGNSGCLRVTDEMALFNCGHGHRPR
jgi:hypothetical protein